MDGTESQNQKGNDSDGERVCGDAKKHRTEWVLRNVFHHSPQPPLCGAFSALTLVAAIIRVRVSNGVGG